MERQKEILQIFAGDKQLVLKKVAIKNLGKISYYHSTDKHLGFTLSRMVANGNLIRVKQGYYRLGSGNKMVIQPKNQLKLL